MKVTPTFLYPIFGLETTTTCPGCGLGTKLRYHNFVVVPRFTTRDLRRGTKRCNMDAFSLILSHVWEHFCEVLKLAQKGAQWLNAQRPTKGLGMSRTWVTALCP